MSEKQVLIIGGYGTVGQKIVDCLVLKFSLIVAGRDYGKAAVIAARYPGRVKPVKVDIAGHYNPDELMADVGVVIVCLDLPDNRLAAECVDRAIDYIDISANGKLLAQIEQVDAAAKARGSHIVLSVGVAPGLTNLLASYCQKRLSQVDHIDLTIMLGMGEAHGEAAIRWTIDNLNTEYQFNANGHCQMVNPFTLTRAVSLPMINNSRYAYNFNFSDQQTVLKTLRYRTAVSWLCFDSKLTGGFFALLARNGWLKVLANQKVKEMLIKIVKACHFGSELFVVQAEASGDGQLVRAAFYGYGEARITALITAEVAEQLLTNQLSVGVKHIEELFSAEHFIQYLSKAGVEFHLTDKIT